MNLYKLIWLVILAAGVVYAWRAGYLNQIADYVRQTRAELDKCTWPTWNELKGSTAVVMTSILCLGAFTVGADAIFVYGVLPILNWLSAST